MTKNEMKERIREIDKERNRLAEEKQSYEKLLRQDMAKEITEAMYRDKNLADMIYKFYCSVH